MPTVPGTNGFEYDLVIDSGGSEYSIDGGHFEIKNKKLFHRMGDMTIPELEFDIDLSATTKGFMLLDRIKLKVRAIGETDYTVRFTGILVKLKRDSRNQLINCYALGMEFLMKNKWILYRAYGNELIEEQELPYDNTGSRGAQVVFQLDATDTIQYPLVRVRIHNDQGGVWGGYSNETTYGIFDQDGSTYRYIDIPFDHPGGALYAMCFSLFHSTHCTTDLVCEILNCDDVNALSLRGTGDPLLTAHLSDASYTSAGWYRMKFSNQQNVLPAGAYCARLKQDGPEATCTPANPGWKIKTTSYSVDNKKPVMFRYESTTALTLEYSAIPLFFVDGEGHYDDYRAGLEYNFDQTTKKLIVIDQNFSPNAQPHYPYPSNLGPHVALGRFTYWKGELDYSSTLEDMLQDNMAGIYDVLDIDVSQPTVTFQSIVLNKCTLWDALMQMREFTTIAWRIWENLSGALTIEMKDKLLVSNWASQTVGYQDAHTFKHGYDDLTADSNAIDNDTFEEELQGIANTGYAYNNLGDAVVLPNNSGDIGSSWLIGAFGAPIPGPGLGLGGLGDLGNMVMGQLRTVAKGGGINLSHIDLSTSSALFLSCNEILNVVDSDVGYNGQYAIKEITIDYGNGGNAQIKLTDNIYKFFIASPTGMNPGYGGLENITQGSKRGMQDPADTFAGVAMSYEVAQMPLGGSRIIANENVVCAPDELGASYDPGNEYYLEIGIGEPAATATTVQITACMVTMDILSLDASYVLFHADIRDDMIEGGILNQFPLKISEMRLTDNVAATDIYKTLGTDKNGVPLIPWDLTKVRPELRKSGGRVSFDFKVHR